MLKDIEDNDVSFKIFEVFSAGRSLRRGRARRRSLSAPSSRWYLSFLSSWPWSRLTTLDPPSSATLSWLLAMVLFLIIMLMGRFAENTEPWDCSAIWQEEETWRRIWKSNFYEWWLIKFLMAMVTRVSIILEHCWGFKNALRMQKWEHCENIATADSGDAGFNQIKLRTFDQVSQPFLDSCLGVGNPFWKFGLNNDQFKIQFKTKSWVFIQKNIHSMESKIFSSIIHSKELKENHSK